jgi:hypothetical protein
MMLGGLGLASKAEAGGDHCNPPGWCNTAVTPCCCVRGETHLPPCNPNYSSCAAFCITAFPHPR